MFGSPVHQFDNFIDRTGEDDTIRMATLKTAINS
jgi:hypothetical protein